jgi:rare lipoprotein A
MFPLGVAAALSAASAGCAMVGYPAPVPGPVTVSARSVPPRPAPAAEVSVVAAASVSAPPTVLRAVSRSYEVFGRSYTTLESSEGYREVGIASWYGEPFNGRPTASGETFDMYALTAAHRTLPLSTCVEVHRVDDDRSIVVRVNDRGPFGGEARRIIDLSYSAGRALGLIGTGTAEVEVRALAAGTAC